MSIAAIILAAGFSRRLGRPKQTILLGSETLVERTLRIATGAGLAPVIVVVNPTGDFGDSLQQRGAILAVNRAAEEGIASSIRTGIERAQSLQASGAVLMTCDQPAVQPDHLRALCAQPEAPAGSRYAGKTGIPAYFPSSSFRSLLGLQGDTGARDLLREARAIFTEDLSFDIDNEADITRAQATFDPGPQPVKPENVRGRAKPL